MDKVFDAWLDECIADAMALADDSDLLDLEVLDRQHFLGRFRCRGLVGQPDVEVRGWERFDLGFWLADDYLRCVSSLDVVTIMAPMGVFHPNAAGPRCCIGPIAPGTPLVDLLHRAYEVISWQEVAPNEFDALNPVACAWARHNRHRFPVDDRPLKRRRAGPPPSALLGTAPRPERAS